MGQEGTGDRYAAYKNPETAHFLLELLDQGGEIKPEYHLTDGYRYPEVEKTIGKDHAGTKEFLRELARLGILDEKLFDMAIYCPSCNKANISTNYVCPFCGSPRIARNALIEHIVCGYIDNLTRFRVNNDLICPRCKARLGKDDYRSAGSWYECLVCGKRVETPRVIHICRECNARFPFDDAKYVEVYSYALSETAKAEIKGGALLNSLAKKILTDLKYDVEAPGRLVGVSGIQHEFDFLLKLEDGKPIAIDILLSKEPVNQTEVIREYGKIFDARVDAYVVASPSVSEDARELVKNYGLNIIEGDASEALNKLKEGLTLKSIQRKADVGGKVVAPPPEKQKKKRVGFFRSFFS